MASDSRRLIGIIGGGPAGIAAAVHLKLRGAEDFVILDERERLGGLWAGTGGPVYAGLRTVTSARTMDFFGYCPNTLPGSEFCSDEGVRVMLDRVVSDFGLSEHLRPRSRVEALSREANGGWKAKTNGATDYYFGQVILATGTEQRAHVPAPWKAHPKVLHSSEASPADLAAARRPVLVGCATSAASLASDAAALDLSHPVTLSVPDQGRWVVPTVLAGRPTDLPVAQSDRGYLGMAFDQFVETTEASLSQFMSDRLPGWNRPHHAPFERAMLISHDLDHRLAEGRVLLASGDKLDTLMDRADLIIMATGFEDSGSPVMPQAVEAELRRLLPPRLIMGGTLGWLRIPNTDLGGFDLIEEVAGLLVQAMMQEHPPQLGARPSLHPSGASNASGFVFGAELLRSLRGAVMSA